VQGNGRLGHTTWTALDAAYDTDDAVIGSHDAHEDRAVCDADDADDAGAAGVAEEDTDGDAVRAAAV
jgi:hypothetical protein